MKKLLLLIAALASTCAFAENKSDPKPDMRLLLDDIQALESFIISEKQFLDSKNESAIEKRLNSMSSHVGGMLDKHFKNDPALQMNLRMLNNHLAETKQYFNSKNKSFARYMLRSSLQMCISCHARMKAGAELDLTLSPEVDTSNSFELAEFFFATRQFSKALDSFKRSVEGYPSNKLPLYSLTRSLNSIAVIYARIKNDPKEASTYFTAQASNKNLPSYVQKDLTAWSNSFKNWQKTGIRDYSKLKDSELLKAAKDLLRKDDFSLAGDSDRKFHVERLRASSILHQILDMPNNSLAKGEALFLLGSIYHRLNNNLFFHFDEMYLRACINDYQKTKLSRDCYDALEGILLEGYSGSAGMSLPDEVEIELMKLKKIAY